MPPTGAPTPASPCALPKRWRTPARIAMSCSKSARTPCSARWPSATSWRSRGRTRSPAWPACGAAPTTAARLRKPAPSSTCAGNPSTGTACSPARCPRRARCRAIRSTARAIGSNTTKTRRARRCRCSPSPSARRRARSSAMRCNGSPSRRRPVTGTHPPTGSLPPMPPMPGPPTPGAWPRGCPGPRAMCTCCLPRSGPMPPAASPMTTS